MGRAAPILDGRQSRWLRSLGPSMSFPRCFRSLAWEAVVFWQRPHEPASWDLWGMATKGRRNVNLARMEDADARGSSLDSSPLRA